MQTYCVHSTYLGLPVLPPGDLEDKGDQGKQAACCALSNGLCLRNLRSSASIHETVSLTWGCWKFCLASQTLSCLFQSQQVPLWEKWFQIPGSLLWVSFLYWIFGSITLFTATWWFQMGAVYILYSFSSSVFSGFKFPGLPLQKVVDGEGNSQLYGFRTTKKRETYMYWERKVKTSEEGWRKKKKREVKPYHKNVTGFLDHTQTKLIHTDLKINSPSDPSYQ